MVFELNTGVGRVLILECPTAYKNERILTGFNDCQNELI